MSMWEDIDRSSGLRRIEVPGGWIYQLVYNGSLCFVPQPVVTTPVFEPTFTVTPPYDVVEQPYTVTPPYDVVEQPYTVECFTPLPAEVPYGGPCGTSLSVEELDDLVAS